MPSSSSAPSPAPRMPVRRRTALASVPVTAAVLAVTGCRWGPENDRPDAKTSAPSNPDGDPQLVDQATAALADAFALVQATSEKHIGLSTPLTTLVALHQTHRDLLVSDPGSDPVETAPPAIPSRSEKALKLVVSTERTLQLTLATIANEVASGDLARALASMSAGVAQAVTKLAELKPGETP